MTFLGRITRKPKEKAATMKRSTAFTPPPFRVHKATNQAYIVVNRKRIYLGRQDAPNTAQK